MSKRGVFLLIGFLLLSVSQSFASYENWPPTTFKQGHFKHLNLKPLSDKEIPSFIEENSELESSPIGNFYTIYKFDIDGNGLDDYVCLFRDTGSPLLWSVEIYLQKQKGKYEKVSYGSCAVGEEDFVDINNDGHYEIIISTLYGEGKHNYIAYSIYQIKNFRLVNADKKFKGFPKFVWMTIKDNDKDTLRLTIKQRKQHVLETNASITYKDIN